MISSFRHFSNYFILEFHFYFLRMEEFRFLRRTLAILRLAVLHRGREILLCLALPHMLAVLVDFPDIAA